MPCGKFKQLHNNSNNMTHQNKKCLIVGPSWVGDMIMAHSLFSKLKLNNPDLIIDVLAPAWSEPLLASMPEINDSIVMPVGHGKVGLGKRYQIGKSLRERQYDTAIILPNSFKSALVPLWANIPERIGYRGEMRYGLINKMHLLDKTNLTMTVQRFVALANEPNTNNTPEYAQPSLTIKQTECDDVINAFALDTESKTLALCPGAEYGPAKCWPAEHYAEVAKTAIQHGWKVWILGSKKDHEISRKIETLIAHKNCRSLAGETTLQQVMTLLSLADQVISNDSGLMHIAAAVSTPVIAIYGSSDPGFTPPLNDTSKVSCLHLECSPCFKRECPLGHLKCLTDITPEQIWSLVPPSTTHTIHQIS